VTDPSLRTSFGVQWRVLHALLMRELITRFGRRNLGVLWLVLEPMIFTLAVMALWSFGGLSSKALPVIPFAITGYSSVLMWRNTVSQCSHTIAENKALFYHRNVRVLDAFLSRVALEVLGASASFVALIALFMLAGVIEMPADLSLVLIGWAMLGWFGLGLALVIGAGNAFSPVVGRVWSPISYVLFPMSGAVFMVDWLPASAREVVLLLPMVHGVEVLREGYFGASVNTHYDLGYMAVINLCLTLGGLLLIKPAARRLEEARSGSST
jgi:ABC-type polysaccharide/polyol phosphate export permease